MKGYKTIIINSIALICSLLAGYGFEIAPEDQSVISTAILAIVNIFLRFKTDSPVFNREREGTQVSKSKEAGFANYKMLLVTLAICSASMVGCSIIQEVKNEPIVKCSEIVKPTTNSIGACYSTISTLATSISTLYQANAIDKETKNKFLGELQTSLDILHEIENYLNPKSPFYLGKNQTLAEIRIRIAQRLLETLSKNIKSKEG